MGTLLWANKELIAKIAGIIALLFFCWWFFIHNPKVIKQLEFEKAEALHQIELRDNAIALLGTIERKKDEVKQQSARNITVIRTEQKPSRTGYFVLGGVLPAVLENYSAQRAAPVNDSCSVLP